MLLSNLIVRSAALSGVIERAPRWSTCHAVFRAYCHVKPANFRDPKSAAGAAHQRGIFQDCRVAIASASTGCEPAPARSAEIDSRTQMLLEQPIAPMILRLAIPNATVMIVQILIGLVEVYFVSRTGVDALAGVAPVFPLVSLVVAVAQGAIGGGIVTTVARALGAGRIGAASEYAWYAVALGVPLGLATTAAMHALGPTLYGQMGISGNALEIAVSYSSTIFAGATLIWLFNLLMAVVRGTGNLQVPVIVVCGGALILVPLSPALIFGAFGYQGLGPFGRRRRDACVLCVRNACLCSLSLGPVWRPQAVISSAKAFPGPALAVLRVGGMSAVVSASTNLTLAIVTAYVGMGGVEALAGYGAGSRLEFLLVPLAYGIGGPVGIVISANLGAGQIERAVKASWIGVLMACALTELIGLAAAAFPQAMDRDLQPRSVRVASRRRISAPRRAVLWILRHRLRALLRRTGDQTNGSLGLRRPAQGSHRGARRSCGGLAEGRRHMEFHRRGIGNGGFRPVRIAASDQSLRL